MIYLYLQCLYNQDGLFIFTMSLQSFVTSVFFQWEQSQSIHSFISLLIRILLPNMIGNKGVLSLWLIKWYETKFCRCVTVHKVVMCKKLIQAFSVSRNLVTYNQTYIWRGSNWNSLRLDKGKGQRKYAASNPSCVNTDFRFSVNV